MANYYLETGELGNPCCEFCPGRPVRLHIGKSSGGWCFALHSIPDLGLTSLDAWKTRWQVGRIVNEYDETIAPEKMEAIVRRDDIAERPRPSPTEPARSYAALGPKNLFRHTGEGVTPGEGAWDMCEGEFS